MAIKRTPLAMRRDSEIESSNPQVASVVMGIDPGTNFMGYAVLRIVQCKPQVEVMGTITLSKLNDPYQKLAHIFERLSSLISHYCPQEMALEAPFYGTNVQSMLKLGRAQGVAMAAALAQKIDVFEYAPTRIKQAITGQGRASKEQVAAILAKILEIDIVGQKLDSTDALAVALCHIYTQNSPVAAREKSGRSSSWETYINQNPNKIKK